MLERNKVQFQIYGEMMLPRVHPDDYCLLEPVIPASELRQGDTVFAEVRVGMFRCQPILKIECGPAAESAYFPPPGDLVHNYHIGSNMADSMTCYKHHIYGRLFEVICVTAASAPEASTASSSSFAPAATPVDATPTAVEKHN